MTLNLPNTAVSYEPKPKDRLCRNPMCSGYSGQLTKQENKIWTQHTTWLMWLFILLSSTLLRIGHAQRNFELSFVHLEKVSLISVAAYLTSEDVFSPTCPSDYGFFFCFVFGIFNYAMYTVKTDRKQQQIECNSYRFDFCYSHILILEDLRTR